MVRKGGLARTCGGGSWADTRCTIRLLSAHFKQNLRGLETRKGGVLRPAGIGLAGGVEPGGRYCAGLLGLRLSLRQPSLSWRRADRRPCRADRRPCRADRRPCRADRRPCRADRRPCRADRRPCRADRRPCRADRRPCRSLAGATAGLLGLRLSLRQPSLSWSWRRSATLQEPGGRYRWTFRAAPFSPPALSFLELARIGDLAGAWRALPLDF